MSTPAFLTRLEAAPGAEEAVEKLLSEVAHHATTEHDGVWWALRFGSGEHAIFTTGAPPPVDDLERDPGLLDGGVLVEELEVLAAKVLPKRQVGKAMVLRLPIRTSKADQAVELLRSSRTIVESEIETLAWFAVRFPDGDLGVVDAFPDRHGRRAHLAGRVPRELAKHSFQLLDGFPSIELADVVTQVRPS